MAWGISIGVHIVGLVMWLGGMMILTRALKLFAGSEALPSFARRTFHGFVLPGAVLSVSSGLYQLLSVGVSHYMQQGWFHGKLTFVVALFVVTFLLFRQVRTLRTTGAVDPRHATILHAASGTLLLVIVFLTTVGRL